MDNEFGKGVSWPAQNGAFDPWLTRQPFGEAIACWAPSAGSHWAGAVAAASAR